MKVFLLAVLFLFIPNVVQAGGAETDDACVKKFLGTWEGVWQRTEDSPSFPMRLIVNEDQTGTVNVIDQDGREYKWKVEWALPECDVLIVRAASFDRIETHALQENTLHGTYTYEGELYGITTLTK